MPPASASFGRPRARVTRCSIWPAISPRDSPGPGSAASRTSAPAPMPRPGISSATGARCIAANPITAATSAPSPCWTRKAGRPRAVSKNPGRRPGHIASRGGALLSGRLAWAPRLGLETAMAVRNGAIKLVAGNSNPALADAIAGYLKTPLTKAVVRRFADMEIFVEIQENVRGADVFVIQSTSFPANDHLMELLIIIDALRRASGRRVTAVVPYFGYARQDRKPGPRTPISAKLVANLITHAGADRVMTLDLHAGQIQGFFDIPTDNLYAAPVMARDVKAKYKQLGNVVVVSPDIGGVVRARALAKRFDAQLAIVDKRRERPGESEVMNIIGAVAGKDCLLIDDIVDSGGTLCNAAEALLAN